MARVRLVRSTLIEGQFVGEGLHELSDEDAKTLIRLGVAIAVTPTDDPIPRVDSGVLTVEGAPVVDHRDPPARRRR